MTARFVRGIASPSTMRSRRVVALDIGSTKVACVLGQPAVAGPWSSNGSAGRYDMVSAGLARHAALPLTWPSDPRVLAETIERALEEARVPPTVDRVQVTVSHPHLRVSRVTAQVDVAHEPIAIRTRDLRRVSAQAVSQALGIDQEVLWLEPVGYQGNGFEDVRDPRGLLTTRLSGTFTVVAIPLALKQILAQACELVGLDMEQLIYSVPAVAAACLDERARSARLLVIDVGGCSTDLALWEQGTLTAAQIIPWGGMGVVEAIAKAGRLTMEQALAASLEGFASPKPSVRQLVERHWQLLDRHLQAFLVDRVLPDQAVMTGRGALLDGAVEWVERATKIPTRLGRSAGAKACGDLPRQVALSAALGLLELLGRGTETASWERSSSPLSAGHSSSGFLNRLIDRAKYLLVDYF